MTVTVYGRRIPVRQAGKWGVRAVGGLAANLALLTLWVEYVGLAPEIAIVPNWVILSVSLYAVTDRWVFASLASPGSWWGHIRRFVSSESVMLAAKAVNYGIYVAAIPLMDYRLAWVVGAIVGVAVSFTGNRWLWTE